MALGLLAPLDEARMAGRYERDIADDERVVLAAEQDGDVVGMGQLALDPAENGRHRAEIQRVAVAPDARGGGVGRALMRALEDAARGRGVTLAWLTTHDGTDATHFYESIGYTKLGVVPNWARTPDGALAANAFYYRELS
ncbi:MAG TPA: GNAT family N-acetyltransferase [Gaiellaceae bacterium]|jgi:ribosomal protein S18 acetylase RimI-like enzyme|nr:GNAT family N-acetyltransferase [Gaiellaceae bacterium]